MMGYQLFSNGRLLSGADEDKALQAIIKITKLSETHARTLFLSGEQMKAIITSDKERLDKICLFLRGAGVDVEVAPSFTTPRATPPVEDYQKTIEYGQHEIQDEITNHESDHIRAVVAGVTVISLIVGSLVGYGLT